MKSHILWLLRQNIRNFDFLLIIDSYTRFAKSLNYKKTMVYLGKLTVSFMYKEWIRGDTHMTITLRWVGSGGGKAKMSGVGNYSGRLNSPYDQTRHHTEPRLIFYWQEISFLTLTSDSEAILQWYQCIVCGLKQTIERVANLNVTWPGFVFVLISFIHIYSAFVVPWFVYFFKFCK